MSNFFIHRPLQDRTPFLEEYSPSPFDSTHTQTLRLLEDELWHLSAENVVIELDVVPSQIRRDGNLNERARVVSPAVRLTFDSAHGQLAYATDRFVRNYKGPHEDWKHNLRAIALGLEALRKVDRYGIAQHGEQYSGYAALPAGTGGIALGGMTKDQAIAVLGGPSHPEFYEAAWKRARFGAHPDRNGGDQSKWDQVEQAARVLGLTS